MAAFLEREQGDLAALFAEFLDTQHDFSATPLEAFLPDRAPSENLAEIAEQPFSLYRDDFHYAAETLQRLRASDLPMQAAAKGEWDGLRRDCWVHLWMEDGDARQGKEYETQWGAFWGAANLLQFLPPLIFVSARGIQQGLYGTVFQAAEPSWEEPAADGSDAAQWQEIAKTSLFGEHVYRLRDARVPSPEVGIELVDEAGMELPEIELLWREQRIAVVASVEQSGRAALERLGWTVLNGLDDGVVAELTVRLAPRECTRPGGWTLSRRVGQAQRAHRSGRGGLWWAHFSFAPYGLRRWSVATCSHAGAWEPGQGLRSPALRVFRTDWLAGRAPTAEAPVLRILLR